MHARFTSFEMNSRSYIKDAPKVVKVLIDASKSHEGFQSIMVLSDRDRGKGVVVSFWKDEASLIQTESNGEYRNQIAEGLNILTSRPTREQFEAFYIQ
jgi:heme-degrading monooxygenase HmoA